MAARTVELLRPLPAVAVVSSDAEFLAMRDEWSLLLSASRADCIFLTWEWLYTWWKHLHSDFTLAIHTVHIGEQLIAIAPWIRRDAQPFDGRMLPTYEFLGGGFAGSDYLDIIVLPEHEAVAVASLARHLAVSPVALRLSNVLARESTTAALVDALADDGWTTDRIQINVCPFIPIEHHSWDTYLASVGSETRYNFNRKWKRLNRDFAVEFAQATAETLAGSLATTITQHNARWDGRGGSDAFHTIELVGFHQEFCRVALEKGWLRLFTLNLNGVSAASLYGLDYRERFYFYQSGLDTAFEKQSVGFLTMGLAIQHAIAEGRREYDLLHGSEGYKFHWATLTRPLFRFESYPPTMGGSIARGVLQLGRISRNVARRVLTSTPT